MNSYLNNSVVSIVSELLEGLLILTKFRLKFSTANIKEVWKASKNEDYPNNLRREKRREGEEPSRNRRSFSWEEMTEGGKTSLVERSLARDT